MSHYFDPAPTSPSRPGRVLLQLPGSEVELAVDRGVFSATGVDPGTLELLRAGLGRPGAGPASDRPLLDLGCGYGPIAVTLARRYPNATVWAVDVNARALELAAANARALGLEARIRPARPDEVPGDLCFDGIWSNPPIRIGKEALHDLLLAWLPRLRPGAAAWMVVQRHLGADSLSRWLVGEGWPVRRLGSKKGYRLLQVGPAGEPEPGASRR
ncbi:MAG: methyltransferase [Actinomycetota bacterium]|nr:methyltransferase [Actinomycetota bacterium]